MFTEYDFEELVCKTIAKNGWRYVPAEDLPRNYSDVLELERFCKLQHVGNI